MSRKPERTMGNLTAIITRDSRDLGERYDVDTVYRELRRAQLSKQGFCSSFCDSKKSQRRYITTLFQRRR